MTFFNYLADTKMTEQIEAFKKSFTKTAGERVEKKERKQEHSSELESALNRISELEKKHSEMLRVNYSMFDLVNSLIQCVTPCIQGTSQYLQSPTQSPASTSYSTPSVCSSQPARGEEVDREARDTPDTLLVDARRIKEQRTINRLVSWIDARAAHYNRDRLSVVGCGGDIVPGDFALAWGICCNIKNEENKGTFQDPFSFVREVICPYPRVNWQKVNTYMRKNLPIPERLPLHSCPQDPYCYPDKSLPGWPRDTPT